ncbi:NADP-dependent oxidoreductase domain-containing protein [Lyophyllum atratum]|nr:NADP-dependent oxidoreductase domain-containing protein [Lyophyllum atratum]
MPFENVKLNDGHEIPAIAFGTGTALGGKDATDYVVQAIETGFSHIDTAQIYRNEDSVGEAIRVLGLPREELYVTTKYWSGKIQETIRESLAKLGLKYVDLYLIHQPYLVEGDFEGAWRELEKIKKDGLARSIGVSNFNVEQLQTIVKIAKIKPAVNQIQFHPYNYAEHKSLLEYAAKHGIVIEAYSSLAPITKFPGGPVDAPVNDAAERLGITPTQVILAWVKAKGVVIVTTSSTKKHLEEYLAVADLAPLTDEEIAAIDDAGAKGPPSTSFIRKVSRKVVCGFSTVAAVCAVYILVRVGMYVYAFR